MNRRTFLLTPLALVAAGRKPNVVLIVARGWRGQATPWAGDADLKAPRLEAFAKESLVFPRAYAAYPHPAPARAAILTGRYPHSTGVIGDGTSLPKDEITLDGVLRDAGYETGRQVGAATDFLQKDRSAPFFLHILLEPPRATLGGDWDGLHVRENVPSETTPSVRAELAKRYTAYSDLDRQLGKILDGIKDMNTVVAFTSDCGEQIGSHGLQDDDIFYEESTRVPLAIRFPGVLRPSASDVPISHVDVMPTLLGLCSETPVEGAQGHDLAPLLMGGQGDRPESVFVEGRIGQKDEWRMLVLGFDKIVVNGAGDVTHLFNLAQDPYELNNLVHDPALNLKRAELLAIVRATRSRLLDFKRR